MQFSAYARAYRCCTRASSTPDAGPPPGETSSTPRVALLRGRWVPRSSRCTASRGSPPTEPREDECHAEAHGDASGHELEEGCHRDGGFDVPGPSLSTLRRCADGA